MFTFRIKNGEAFGLNDRARIKNCFDLFRVISFNGLGYDVSMIRGVLAGYNTNQLKWLNDQIIVEGVKPWDLGLGDWSPKDHIDVMEVAPGTGSLKMYGGRIHARRLRDLPYDPSTILTEEQMIEVDLYCENDNDELLLPLWLELQPHIKLREQMSAKFGIDLRSKSDAQVAEAILKLQCEKATGRKIYKREIDWNLSFRYTPPEYIQFSTPQLNEALEKVRNSVFRLGASGAVEMPDALSNLQITIGRSTYKLGIGGLHSSEKCVSHYADDDTVILEWDVISFYPKRILNSGAWPPALGPVFLEEYERILDDRLRGKKLQKTLKEGTSEYEDAKVLNEGGKIQLNGTFGKLGSPYSVLFAPEMLIRTTIGGQLSLLMLIEWHEYYGMPVVSANTDGILIKCRADQMEQSKALVKEWERRTGLVMELGQYRSIHSRDVNSYVAVKLDGSVKRKGEFALAGLDAKKNPSVEICSDAVSEYVSKGTPLLATIAGCRDIRKFVHVQKVAGGGVKLWGEGPRKGALVRDMVPVLEANGWIKHGRLWKHPTACAQSVPAVTAYRACFAPQRPEYLGKVVRWYYATNSPGPIVYQSNGNTVGMSYGAHPCMDLPDQFPDNVDYLWYLRTAKEMLDSIDVNSNN